MKQRTALLLSRTDGERQQAFIEALPDDLYATLSQWVRTHVETFFLVNKGEIPEGWDPTHEFGEEAVCRVIVDLWPYFIASHRDPVEAALAGDPIVDSPGGAKPFSEAKNA